MQKRNYLLIVQPFPPNVYANLLYGNAFAPKQESLALGHVLIKDVHTGSGA